MGKRLFYICILLLLFITNHSCTIFQDERTTIITFKQNGGWCWFQDERAILHDGILVFGSVANAVDPNGVTVAGNVEVTSYNVAMHKQLGTYILHEKLEADDHNAPAFLLLNDKRVLAMYSKHGTDATIRYRVTKNPTDYLNWEPESSVNRDANVTYSNLHFLSYENNRKGRIYNFYRGENWNPNYIVSEDNGKAWKYGGHLIQFAGRPYVKYISDGKEKIHFITTEHHPRNYDNGIYHAYIEKGKLFKSNGTFIKNLSDGPMMPTEGTKIFS